MEFISPAKTFDEYTIGNKKLIIIGEEHSNANPEHSKTINTWDLIKKYHDELGYTILLELPENFDRKNKKINSINILKTLEQLGDTQRLVGVDIRGSNDFFGKMADKTFQGKFFLSASDISNYKLYDIIYILENIMRFINKQIYAKYAKTIEQINKDYLVNLFNFHKEIDSEVNRLKREYPNQKTKVGDVKDFFRFHEMTKHFLLLFTDLVILLKILSMKSDKFVLLIGYQHSQNFRKLLYKYHTTFINQKLTAKEKKLVGVEVKPNKVFVKFALRELRF